MTAPITFSDRTCLDLWGVEWRVMLRFLNERGIHVSKIGRRPAVRVDVVLRALDGETTGAELLPWNEAEVIALASRRPGAR
jgi:hypothetical protein